VSLYSALRLHGLDFDTGMMSWPHTREGRGNRLKGGWTEF